MAKIKEKKSYFWTTYSDLMSSLFFIILVLFILTIAMLFRQNKATKAQLEKIKQINKSIEKIDNKYFEYDEDYKRHTLKDIQVSFNKGSDDIYDIPYEDRSKLISAGNAIVRFMTDAKFSKDTKDSEYLLIIEGQTSKDNYKGNYELSFRRALSLVNLWRNYGINFDNLPCELIVSGSGQDSHFRMSPDNRFNRNNQRFVIHILPKPGKID